MPENGRRSERMRGMLRDENVGCQEESAGSLLAAQRAGQAPPLQDLGIVYALAARGVCWWKLKDSKGLCWG